MLSEIKWYFLQGSLVEHVRIEEVTDEGLSSGVDDVVSHALLLTDDLQHVSVGDGHGYEGGGGEDDCHQARVRFFVSCNMKNNLLLPLWGFVEVL